ncbi:Oidioi.mRNA.OKI2018_I69.chr1.g3496.t1.cds [Oikopleura dioica]|uniref:Splicing factor YJU2 n=1 Tax=Oikopleura dioica TaxID=34765 RepID=A0ABN7T151_OIKDI|nr:Oidioi.mRNA.OKI2018_I69.chr1.g3496.t1.cds [Oikopleura dioica]
MSERKVLNKYYPPDYDPRRLPRNKGAGAIEDKIMIIRTMAPFHMRCKTCGNYIYRGTKFNSRVETIKGEKYLGTIPIRRFYIRCTKCVATITFKTDPANQDYAMESGATRNFEANRMWQLMEKREEEAKAEEERLNPMIALENRTQKSNAQLIMQENLEEIFELAEMAGDADKAQLKALKKINDEREFQQKLQEFLLEKDINILSESQQDLWRLGKEDEKQEDQDQVDVLNMLKDVKSSDYLTLNLEEEENPILSSIEDKRSRQLREALDKKSSLKKFGSIVKVKAKTTEGKKKGMSYREFQEQVKRNEAAKKAAEAAKEKAKAQLVSGFAGYGSSSSDEETTDNKEENEEPTKMEDDQAPTRIPTEVEEIPENTPAESDSDEEPPASLPAGFFAKPEVPEPKAEEPKEKEPESKKRKAEFGSNDFWNNMIKKKS